MAVSLQPGNLPIKQKDGTLKFGNYPITVTASASVNNDYSETQAAVTITCTANFDINTFTMSHGAYFTSECGGQTNSDKTRILGNSNGGEAWCASHDFDSYASIKNLPKHYQPFTASHTYLINKTDNAQSISWKAHIYGSVDFATSLNGYSNAGKGTESGTVTVASGHTHSNPSGVSTSASNVNQTSMTINRSISSWGCSDASAWLVYYKKSSDSSYTQKTATLSNTTYSLTGLTPGTNYNIKIKCNNTHGYGTESSVITQRTDYATPSVSVSNGNKLNNQNGISASTNSITVSASSTVANQGTLTWSYQIKKNGGSYGSSQSNATFTNLEPGTTYIVKATATNPDNYSHSAEVTIRTKYAQSNFITNISASDIGLEHINFTATVKYGTTNVISSGTWSIGNVLTNQVLNISSATGTGETGYVLAAATTYTINVVVTLTSTYDSIECRFSQSFNTDAKSIFADNLGNFDFCYPTEVAANYKITNSSGNAVRCSLVVGGTTILTRDKSSSWDSSVNLQLTDAEWDAIYKKLGNNNSIAYTFTVGTYSNKNKNYTTYTTDSTGTITLTGKMKTAHVGLDDGSVKRAQARVGVNNQVRLAVVWVGDKDGKPMRMI